MILDSVEIKYPRICLRKKNGFSSTHVCTCVCTYTQAYRHPHFHSCSHNGRAIWAYVTTPAHLQVGNVLLLGTQGGQRRFKVQGLNTPSLDTPRISGKGTETSNLYLPRTDLCQDLSGCGSPCSEPVMKTQSDNRS